MLKLPQGGILNIWRPFLLSLLRTVGNVFLYVIWTGFARKKILKTNFRMVWLEKTRPRGCYMCARSVLCTVRETGLWRAQAKLN